MTRNLLRIVLIGCLTASLLACATATPEQRGTGVGAGTVSGTTPSGAGPGKKTLNKGNDVATRRSRRPRNDQKSA